MDPFYEHPYSKPFYHPSSPRKWGKAAKETYLIAHRDNAGSEEVDDTYRDKILRGSNVYRLEDSHDTDFRINNDVSPSFDESWPQSDRPSSISIPDVDESFVRKLSPTRQDSNLSTRYKPEKDSVALKYVERFRNAEPLSRDDRRRQQAINREDFWWLKSSDSKAALPTKSKEATKETAKEAAKETADSKAKRDRVSKLSTDALRKFDRETQGDGFAWKNLEDKSRVLQERVDRLLDESESSLNSSHLAAVSTAGLGSVATTTAGSTFEEELYRPDFVRKRDAAARTTLGLRRSKEEDILDQWRRRRRMEIIKEGTTRGVELSVPSQSDVLAAFRKRLVVAEQDKDGGSRVAYDAAEDDRCLSKVSQTIPSGAQKQPHVQLMRDAVVQTSVERDSKDYRQPVEEHTSNAGVQTIVFTTPVDAPTRAPTRTEQNGEQLLTSDDDCCERKTNRAEKSRNEKSDLQHDKELHSDRRCVKTYRIQQRVDEFEKLSTVSSARVKTPSQTESVRIDESKLKRTSSKQHESVEGHLNDPQSLRSTEISTPRSSVEKDTLERQTKLDRIGSLDIDDIDSQTSRTNVKHRGRGESKLPKQTEQNKEYDRQINLENVSSRYDPPVKDNAQFNSLDSVVLDSSPSDTVSPTPDIRDRRTTRLGTDEGTDRLPLPRSHSSPTRLKNVINQVISERLFGSSCSVISSLEDMRSSLGIAVDSFIVEQGEQVHSDPPLLIEESEPTSSSDLENLVSSDGEEFKNDEILQDLRRRRTSYIRHLAELDQAIRKVAEGGQAASF